MVFITWRPSLGNWTKNWLLEMPNDRFKPRRRLERAFDGAGEPLAWPPNFAKSTVVFTVLVASK